VTAIESLADVRPGDIYFGPIGGAVGVGVALGQVALGEGFRVGPLSIRHVGIVVGNDQGLHPDVYMVQAMPHGAEQILMTPESHWTSKCAYVRLPEDYPGQAEDAAAIAQLMVAAGSVDRPTGRARSLRRGRDPCPERDGRIRPPSP
jgi:hypothetical protein